MRAFNEGQDDQWLERVLEASGGAVSTWQPPERRPRPTPPPVHWEGFLLAVQHARDLGDPQQLELPPPVRKKTSTHTCAHCGSRQTSQWRMLVGEVHCNSCYARLRRWLIKHRLSMGSEANVRLGLRQLPARPE